jgi:hypothetical protein
VGGDTLDLSSELVEERRLKPPMVVSVPFDYAVVVSVNWELILRRLRR